MAENYAWIRTLISKGADIGYTPGGYVVMLAVVLSSGVVATIASEVIEFAAGSAAAEVFL